MSTYYLVVMSGLKEFAVDCFFTQEWYDHRLDFLNSSWGNVSHISLHYSLLDSIWQPDTYFRNLIDGSFHSITVSNRLLLVYPDGKIKFSQR